MWYHIILKAVVYLVGAFFAMEALGSIANGATRIWKRKEENGDWSEVVDWREFIEFPLRGLRIIAGIILATGSVMAPTLVWAGMIFASEASLAIGFRLEDVSIKEGDRVPSIEADYAKKQRHKFRIVRAALGIVLLEAGHLIA